MRVTLTGKLKEFVNQSVSSGRFPSADEAVRAGLRLLREQEAERQKKLKKLKAEIQKGIDDIENGRYTTHRSGDFREFAEELKKELKERLKKQQRA